MRPFLTLFRRFASRKYPSLKDTLESHVKKLTDDSDIEGLLSSLSKAEELPAAMPSPGCMSAELDRWASESRSLKAHLVSYIIEQCEQFDRRSAEDAISTWLQGLSASEGISAVHFFTTNYDRILEYVSEYAGVPLDDGFATSERDLVAPWTGEFNEKLRLYKLHGSVTYYVDRKRAPTREFLRLDRGYPLPDPDFRLSRQGRELEPLMVLPTLEKETMDDPYGHLMHIFQETLSQGGLVVAMGTSLRDAHLVSVMNFNRDKIVVLVIDNAPTQAICQIPNLRAVALKADISDCLRQLSAPLLKLTEQCASISENATRFDVVNRFVAEQEKLMRIAEGMSEEEQQQVAVLQRPDSDLSKLEALRRLQRTHHPDVMNAVAACLKEEQSPAVRKAAAGCLGLVESAESVDVLAELATQDELPDVRLESYLALRKIGGNKALNALEVARKNWPEDPFFWDGEMG